MSDLHKELIADIKKLIRSYEGKINKLQININESNVQMRELNGLSPPPPYSSLVNVRAERNIFIIEKKTFESISFDLSNLDAILHEDND